VSVSAWIGIGGNLGDPLSTVRSALNALAQIESCRLVRQSSLYRSAPIGPGVEGQPDYINAVAELETTLDAQALLNHLFELEESFGRQRGALNAARTLDLDLLLHGTLQINQPGLIVPHPRMHERAFVLLPIAELAPQTAIPGHGTVERLVAGLYDQGICRLPV
jgi:2-amino-4-hydroxy-6-hydroxymethyldihydropteridine diphosphokinase